MNKTPDILRRFDDKTRRMVNVNGTSDFWSQIDTDTIVSPKHRRYCFFIMGIQNLETGEWKFYYHEAPVDGFGFGKRVNELEGITTPRQALKWYYAQK